MNILIKQRNQKHPNLLETHEKPKILKLLTFSIIHLEGNHFHCKFAAKTNTELADLLKRINGSESEGNKN